MSKSKAEIKLSKLPAYNDITTKVAAIWTRVSSEGQEKNNCSLDTQKTACEDYARTHGIRIKAYYGGTHESAKTEGIRHKQMVREVLRDKEINVILVRTFDRFGRAGAETILIKEELKRHGVYVISATEPFEPDNPMGIAMQNFMDLFSQMENNIRRDKTYSGMVASLNRGEWCLHVPMGYSRLGKIAGHHNIVVNEEGEKLRLAFQWKAAGVRQVDIVDRLKAMGVHITKQRLFRVLTNPFYTGWIVHEWVEGGRIMGHHEVLIDEATFNLANGISRRGYEQRETTDEYPLKRHVRCADCGGFLTGYEVKKKHIHYYKCNKKGCCCNYSAKYLHRKYMELLEQYMIPEDKIADVSADLMEIFTAINKSKNERCNQLKSEIAEIEKKKRGVKYKYGVGEIEKDIYAETISQLTLEQSEIEEKLVLVSDKLSNLPRTMPRLLLIFCKLGSLWSGGDYGFRQKLQNLLFPHGVCFDKKTGNYRTMYVNIIAERIAAMSATYSDAHKKRDCDFHQQSRFVAQPGLEPRQTEPESVVLPLHH